MQENSARKNPDTSKSLTVSWNRARVLVRFDHTASVIVNSDHGILWSTEKLRVIASVAGLIRLPALKACEWEHIRNQIGAAIIGNSLARS